MSGVLFSPTRSTPFPPWVGIACALCRLLPRWRAHYFAGREQLSARLAAADLAPFALLALIADRCRTGRVGLLGDWRRGQVVVHVCHHPLARTSGRRCGHRRRRGRRSIGGGRRYRLGVHGRCRDGRCCNRRCLPRCGWSHWRSFDRRRISRRGAVRSGWRRRYFDWRFARTRLLLALRGGHAGQRERYREQEFGHAGDSFAVGSDEPPSTCASSPLHPEPGPCRRG